MTDNHWQKRRPEIIIHTRIDCAMPWIKSIPFGFIGVLRNLIVLCSALSQRLHISLARVVLHFSQQPAFEAYEYKCIFDAILYV